MSLFVGEYGLLDSPPVVFLHGGGGAGWMWQPQVESLRDHYHILVPDLPEQGRSTDAGKFTIQSAAEQVAELIGERVPRGRAHLVGLSEGGQVVAQMLASTPEIALSAIISSALVRAIPGASGMASPGTLKWTYRLTVRPFRDADWWIRWNMHAAAGVPDEYFDEFKDSFRNLTENGFVNLMMANQTFRLPEGLGRVSVPVLVVCGAGEYEAMKHSARDIENAIPHAKAREVNFPEGTSLAEQHNWNMTAPTVFNGMVRAWIEGGQLPPQLAVLSVE